MYTAKQIKEIREQFLNCNCKLTAGEIMTLFEYIEQLEKELEGNAAGQAGDQP